MNTDILIAILGGGNLLLFIKFLIERYDKKKSEDIKGTLKKLEKDGLRTQLLLLILLKPDEKTEILTLGQRYFVKPPAGLGGNWYMTSIFKNWCDGHKLKPEWFKSE